MAELVSLLEAYLDRVEAETWSPGEWDCLMAPAAWSLMATGVDAGAPWRGRYRDEAGAEAMLSEAGGMIALVGRRLEALGWTRGRWRAARPGAIGVVRLARGMAGANRQPFGAVRYGGGWLIATDSGALFEPARALAHWNLPEGR